MPWPVPWFVGGASHSADIARILPYAAFAGMDGVMGPLDCRILELSTPGTSIRCMPGGTNIRAKGMVSDIQAYSDYLASEDVVPISATDASGGRSDLVIARVEDPNQPGGGWTATSPTDGPFQFTRVIPNVPSTTYDVSQVRPNDSAITLARIDIPASTGTITQDMIVDLRSVIGLSGAQRFSETLLARELFSDNKHASSNSTLPGSGNTFIDFPAEGVWQVPIPSWATGMDAIIDYNAQTDGHVWGEARLLIGGSPGVATAFDANEGAPAGGGYRVTVKIGGTHSIPAALRGTITEFKLQGRQRAGEGFTLSDLVANPGTYITFFLHFKRDPVFT